MYERSHRGRRAFTRTPHRLGTAVLLAFLGLAIGSLFWPSSGSRPKPIRFATPSSTGPVASDLSASFVGASACRECHPGEAASQARSGHSRTLRKAAEGFPAEWLDGRPFRDPEQPDVAWSFRLEDGSLVAYRSQGGRTDSLRLEFGLGSGHRGVTFVTTERGREANPFGVTSGIEHRISYFAHRNSPGITPGQTLGELNAFGPQLGPHGRKLTPSSLRECFSCHSTLLSRHSTYELDPDSMVPNVTCERCHGPGRDHVEAVGRGETDLKVLATREDSDPAGQILLCGECHRTVQSVSGTKLNPDNSEIVRYQPVGLSLSACFDKAASGLKCTTCHDPHSRTSGDHAAYNAVCVSCHRQVGKQRICPRSPADGCTGCHMPRRETPGGSQFTDHWIRIRS